jgi:hypothetical protein
MGRRREWHRVNARSLDRRTFGPVVAAFEHNKLQETFLLHLKFVSRNHPRYGQEGVWAVVERMTVVRRKAYLFKAINRAPMRWANEVLRLHAQGVFAREAAEGAAAQEADQREWRDAQARREQRMEDKPEVELDPFERWLRECYERRIGPINDEMEEAEASTPPPQAEEVQLPVELRPYEDDRKKRHRSLINYHLPAAYDELPSKLVPLRRRTLRGMLRRAGRRRGKRRRGRKSARSKTANAGAARETGRRRSSC